MGLRYLTGACRRTDQSLFIGKSYKKSMTEVSLPASSSLNSYLLKNLVLGRLGSKAFDVSTTDIFASSATETSADKKNTKNMKQGPTKLFKVIFIIPTPVR